MQTVRVAFNTAVEDRGYPIHIGAGLLDRAELLRGLLAQPRVAVVTNETVAPIYLARLRKSLEAAGVRSIEVILPDGEEHKTWTSLARIHDAMLEARCDRQTSVIALGGGVVGDLAGFAAATYMRGVPFVQMPTTLLAQVDSSVGGKTGINHPLGKNMIGAFHQPSGVLADMDTLRTLPERELSAGLAEVIKHGLLADAVFFEWLEREMERLVARDPEALAHSVKRSVEIKAGIVSIDERETGPRALLNLGHTFGHAIEAGLGFGTWLHGEAVGAGLVMAAELSRRLGHLSAADVTRTRDLVRRAKLPVVGPRFDSGRYLQLMSLDKKVKSGRLRFILMRRLGEAYIEEAASPDAVEATLATCVE